MAAWLIVAVLGASAGAFVKTVLWENHPETWFWALLLGAGGGLAGGFLRTRLAGAAVAAGFDGFSMLLALLGAALLLTAYGLWIERRPAVRTGGSVQRHAA